MIKFTDDIETWVDCGTIASDVPIATTSVPGKVQPDGTTITVDANGVISGAASYYLGDTATWESKTLEEKLGYEEAHFDDDDEFAAPDLYSESEVKTNKVWIDGKKIYRKVVEATLMSTAGTQTVAHGISNLAQVVNQWGMTTGDASGGMRQLDFCWYNDAKWDSCIYTDSTSIKIQMGEYYASYHGGRKAYIILEYTKTT